MLFKMTIYDNKDVIIGCQLFEVEGSATMELSSVLKIKIEESTFGKSLVIDEETNNTQT